VIINNNLVFSIERLFSARIFLICDIILICKTNNIIDIIYSIHFLFVKYCLVAKLASLALKTSNIKDISMIAFSGYFIIAQHQLMKTEQDSQNVLRPCLMYMYYSPRGSAAATCISLA